MVSKDDEEATRQISHVILSRSAISSCNIPAGDFVFLRSFYFQAPQPPPVVSD